MGTYLIKTKNGLDQEEQKKQLVAAIHECGGQVKGLIFTGQENTWSIELDFVVAKKLVNHGLSVVLSPNQNIPPET